MRDWRCGPPPLSFCTAWRPAPRTRRCPSGLETNDHLTATHNKLGIRLGFLLCIVASTGCFYSVEQPGSSLLLKLACFTRLLQLGGQLAKFCYCSFGCTCGKSTIWLHNKPWMLGLPRVLEVAHAAAPPNISPFTIGSTNPGSKLSRDAVHRHAASCSGALPLWAKRFELSGLVTPPPSRDSSLQAA